MRRRLLACLALASAACHGAVEPVDAGPSQPSAVPVEPEPPLEAPPFCARDLSDWAPSSGSRGMVSLSAEELAPMLRPSMAEAQRRGCDCIAAGSGSAAKHKLVVKLRPGHGAAMSAFQDDGDAAFVDCVGSFETTFPAKPMPCSDTIDPSHPPPADCSPILSTPVVLDFARDGTGESFP